MFSESIFFSENVLIIDSFLICRRLHSSVTFNLLMFVWICMSLCYACDPDASYQTWEAKKANGCCFIWKAHWMKQLNFDDFSPGVCTCTCEIRDSSGSLNSGEMKHIQDSGWSRYLICKELLEMPLMLYKCWSVTCTFKKFYLIFYVYCQPFFLSYRLSFRGFIVITIVNFNFSNFFATL